MACLAPGGCNSGAIRSERLPGPGDDACDTNNNGQFLCIGSYWIYDPTLPGADTATLGICERLFAQLTDECNMADWIEISVPSVVEDTRDPVNGDDCCPPGSLWRNTVTDIYFISLNVDCSCIWCPLCSTVEDPHTSHEEFLCGDTIYYDDYDAGFPDLPPVGTPYVDILPTSITFTNPSAVRSMAVQIVFGGFSAEFGFADLQPTLTFAYVVVPKFYVDGVLQPITGGFYDSGVNISGLAANSFQIQLSTVGITVTRILPPGATETYEMRADLVANIEHNTSGGDAFANIRVAAGCISAQGSTI